MKNNSSIMKSISYNFIFIAIILILSSLSSYSRGNNNKISSWLDYYDIPPDVSNCLPGQLKSTERQNIIDYINMIRYLHGLSPVTDASNDDVYATKAALLFVANAFPGGAPSATWKCFDNDANTGAGKSITYGLFFNDSSATPATDVCVPSWIIDYQNNDPNNVLYDRRTILNPFLKQIAFGRVDGHPQVTSQYTFTDAMVLYWGSENWDTQGWNGDFVACPYQDYPVELFSPDALLSFSAYFDYSTWGTNINVDYSQTVITVKDENNQNMTVSNVVNDINKNYGGVPNIIHWKCAGLVPHVRYDVSLKNVKVNGTMKDFAYWFNINNKNLPPPVPPTLILPENTEQYAGRNPVLEWDSVKSAEYYRLKVSKTNDFSTNIVDLDSLKLHTYSLTNLDINTDYYWEVQAFNEGGESHWSTVWSFKTGVLAPEIPNLSSPANNAQFLGTNPKLKWSSALRAATYHLQVSKASDFSTDIAVDKDGLASTLYQCKDLENDAVYYWRVEAINEGGSSGWSQAWKFTANFQLPSVPTLVAPDNNTTNIETNPEVKWNASDRADFYHFQVSSQSDFTSNIIVEKDSLTVTSYPLPYLDPNIKYYWRVEAFNKGGSGGWSDVWNFTTKLSTPVKPQLVSPTAGSNAPLNPVFQWSRTMNAFTYSFQIATSNDFPSDQIVFNIDNLKDTSYQVAIGVLEKNTTYFWHIIAVNSLGSNKSNSYRFITVDSTISVPFDISIKNKLFYNYPNPFSGKTNIVFRTESDGNVIITLNNYLGQEIMTIFNSEVSEGVHSLEFDSHDLTSGVYFLNFISEKQNFTNIIQIIK